MTSPVPGAGAVLDARMALALNVHACPGVYAVLLGAGISIASGVKTGWDVVQDLVGKVAAVHEPDDPDAGNRAAADPEAWWEGQFGEPLGYSRLLAEAAPTPAARQALLAGYFEPVDGEDAGKQPTAAHRALARLVKRGSIKVILTTNFDRLMERALEEVGISPHVVREHDVAAMKPQPHSQITIIKLHGDYADLEQRNTVDELDCCPDALQQLLERVVDEYGLVVCGWSAEWDKALVRTVEGTRSRRYPMFWSQVGKMSESAARLTARHSAAVLDGVTADELFTDLEQRIEALDRMTVAPVTRDTAVAQLKRYLPNPVRRIDVHDLVDQALTRFLDNQTLDKRPVDGDDNGFAIFTDSIHGYRADADTLLHIVANGVFHDTGAYDGLWLRVVERLSWLREGSYRRSQEHLESLRLYPALMATWTMGVAAVLSRREGILVRLLTEPVSKHLGSRQPLSPATYLNPEMVLRRAAIHAVSQPGNGSTWRYPQSHFLRDELREPLRLAEPDDRAYTAASYRFEFLASMIAMGHEIDFYRNPWMGEYMNDAVWGYEDEGLAGDLAREIEPSWPLLRAGAFGGEEEQAKDAFTRLVEARGNRPR